MPEETASKIAASWWQSGVLGGVAVLALLTVWFLFRFYNKKLEQIETAVAAERKAMEDERKAIAIERANRASERSLEIINIRAEYEEKHRDIVESYAKRASDLYIDNRAHEDAERKDFGELMEKVSESIGKQSAALAEVLQKFLDRFVGPRGRY